MPEKEAGWGIVQWGFTGGAGVVAFVWGYVKMVVDKKIKSAIEISEEKSDGKIKEEIKDMKGEFFKEVNDTVDGFARRTKGEIINAKDKIEANEKRDVAHEIENKNDFNDVHKRINDLDKSTQMAYKELTKALQDGRNEQTTILTKLSVDVAELRGQNLKGR